MAKNSQKPTQRARNALRKALNTNPDTSFITDEIKTIIIRSSADPGYLAKNLDTSIETLNIGDHALLILNYNATYLLSSANPHNRRIAGDIANYYLQNDRPTPSPYEMNNDGTIIQIYDNLDYLAQDLDATANLTFAKNNVTGEFLRNDQVNGLLAFPYIIRDENEKEVILITFADGNSRYSALVRAFQKIIEHEVVNPVKYSQLNDDNWGRQEKVVYDYANKAVSNLVKVGANKRYDIDGQIKSIKKQQDQLEDAETEKYHNLELMINELEFLQLALKALNIKVRLIIKTTPLYSDTPSASYINKVGSINHSDHTAWSPEQLSYGETSDYLAELNKKSQRLKAYCTKPICNSFILDDLFSRRKKFSDLAEEYEAEIIQQINACIRLFSTTRSQAKGFTQLKTEKERSRHVGHMLNVIFTDDCMRAKSGHETEIQYNQYLHEFEKRRTYYAELVPLAKNTWKASGLNLIELRDAALEEQEEALKSGDHSKMDARQELGLIGGIGLIFYALLLGDPISVKKKSDYKILQDYGFDITAIENDSEYTIRGNASKTIEQMIYSRWGIEQLYEAANSLFKQRAYARLLHPKLSMELTNHDGADDDYYNNVKIDKIPSMRTDHLLRHFAVANKKLQSPNKVPAKTNKETITDKIVQNIDNLVVNSNQHPELIEAISLCRCINLSLPNVIEASNRVIELYSSSTGIHSNDEINLITEFIDELKLLITAQTDYAMTVNHKSTIILSKIEKVLRDISDE